MKPKARGQLWGEDRASSAGHGILGRGRMDSASAGVRLLLSHSWAPSRDGLWGAGRKEG